MTSLTELLTYMIVSAGITNIAVYGSIFNRLRPKKGKLGELFHCPMCLGTWVGFALCGAAAYTELFNIEPTLMNYIACGAISSLSSYTASMILGDDGLRVSLGGSLSPSEHTNYDTESLEELYSKHVSQKKHQGGDDEPR